ncbi:MAG: hypothetical protein VKJ86_05625 [Synechococcus sp.]|nr:hypothetical protein [Synechococcus sp.]
MSDVFPQERLGVILAAALKAPGNNRRFHAAGLIDHSGAIAKDWCEQWPRLSVLDKATVRANPSQFMAQVDDIVYRGSTSGSRSDAYLFFAGTAWNQQRLQTRQAQLDWWGITPAVPIVNVASRLPPGRPGDLAVVGEINQGLLQQLRICLAQTESVIRGYPSQLCQVASYLTEPLPPIKAVICTGELLFEHQKDLLERVFQAPVIDEYGCHEGAISGMSCPERGNLHLDEQRCFYEVIDGALVVTDLWNEVMPLVRYRCGDGVALGRSPCACGRPGLVAKVLGRLEDRIQTAKGIQLTGMVPLPSLPHIDFYRLERRSPFELAAWVKLQPHLTPLDAIQAQQSLRNWVESIFGTVQLTLNFEPEQVTNPPKPEPLEDLAWVEWLTQKSIGHWLAQPRMPTGEARAAAQLLQSLLTPNVIGLHLPPAIEAAIFQLLEQPIAKHPQVESLTLRILYFACSCLTQQALAEQCYEKIRARQQRTFLTDPHLDLDQRIAALFLATQPIAWEQMDLLQPVPLDSLHIFHLLSAFETGLGFYPGDRRGNVAKKLLPPLAVLIGDLSFWAQQLTLGHLHHWQALITGCEMQPLPRHSDTPVALWLRWRHRLLTDPASPETRAMLGKLKAIATTPATEARFFVEKSYYQLLRGQPFNTPQQWLERIETHAGGLPSRPKNKTKDLTPWLPLVRALVQPCLDQGERELAYRCLGAVSLASRQNSAFERLTIAFNHKQSFLLDLAPW